MHPWLEAYAARAGGQIGGWTPGNETTPGFSPLTAPIPSPAEAPRGASALQRAFLSRQAMTASDGREFAIENWGHVIELGTLRCRCGLAQRDVLVHRDPMDVPICRLTFPQTGGCSLNEWNAGLAAMNEQGTTGFLSMVRVTNSNNSQTSQPVEPEPEAEIERPKRMILH